MASSKKPKNIRQAVYLKHEVAALFDCGLNQVEDLILAGLIPKPIHNPDPSSRKQRWLRSAIHKALSLPIDFDVFSEPLDLKAEVIKVLKEYKLTA